MNKLAVLALGVFVAACSETPTQSAADDLALQVPLANSVIGADNPQGAIVLNRGEATEPYSGFCRFSGRVTDDVTIVGTANGGAIFKCHWADFPAADYGQAVVIRDWTCGLTFPATGFAGVTNNTTFVLSQDHQATATCIFQDAPMVSPPDNTPPVTEACQGQIVQGIASTWPWAHDDKIAFAPPPGAIALWIRQFGGALGITNVRELQQLFCGI